MSKRTYVTAKRLKDLRSHISDKDVAIIEDVARVNIMSGQQIRVLHFGHSASDRRMARWHLKRLAELQLLARLGRRVGGQHSGSDGFCYALDVAGQRLIRGNSRRARPPWSPGQNQLSHALAVSQLYVELRQLESLRSQLVEFDAEPICWRRYFGPGGGVVWLKPDAYVVTTNGSYDECFMVEVDRDTESATRIAHKLRTYLAYFQSGREQEQTGVFPRVIWSVPSEKRKSQIVDVVAELPGEYWQLFVVMLAHETASHVIQPTIERR